MTVQIRLLAAFSLLTIFAGAVNSQETAVEGTDGPLNVSQAENNSVLAENGDILSSQSGISAENGSDSPEKSPILPENDDFQPAKDNISQKNGDILPENSGLSLENPPLPSNSDQNSIVNSEKNTEHIIPPPESDFLTFDALNQPLTRHYIERYTSPGGLLWINSVIKNGSIYMPFIREEIAKRGLPPELLYLPFVESGYIGTARSKSGAAGLWQFMMNSIAPFGLKVDNMIDERRDFRKSTAAALQKLAENYTILGNWPLALAAYNAGLGGVSRAARRSGTGDYWLLSERNELKTETIHYVPKLMAIAYIVSSPRRYEVDSWTEGEEWAVVNPRRQASLDYIAAETGIDRNLLYRLNPELLYGITPPDERYELKVPLAQADAVAAMLANEDAILLNYYRYRVQYGDTLSALSRHYGVSIGLIEQYNPGILSRYLKIGEHIIIPAFGEVAPYTSEPEETTVPAPAPEFFGGTHLVKQGETLWSLAKSFNIDPRVLARENDMELDAILSIGKILKVPIIENESDENGN